MAVIEVSSENFEQTLTQNDIVLIDFWASWCQPCHSFAPIYELVSENHKDVVFAKVNVDEQKELAQANSIQSIPTLSLFRERILVFSQPGLLSVAQLETLVTQAKTLDMAEVRDEIIRQGE